MRSNSKSVARHAAVLLLIPVFLVAGCQKQSKQQGQQQNNPQATQQQSNPQATQQQFAGGGRVRLRTVCADDIQKYCANSEKKRRCLKDNIDKLSDACKAAVAQRGGRKARNNGSGGNDE